MNAVSNYDAVGHFSATVREFHAYYAHRPDFEERVPVWHALLNKYAVPGGLSIDMGCGTGVFTFELAKRSGQVVGVDGSADMIAFCKAQCAELGLDNVRFVQALLPDVDLGDVPAADLIISSSVVEYVGDLDRTLELFSRLLKPGGSLVLSLPNAFSISRNLERLVHRTTGRRAIYRYIKHFSSPSLLQARTRTYGLSFLEAHHYAHHTRVARLGRGLRLPPALTADLFVTVFRKQ